MAISGKYTTNKMLFKIVYPDAKIIYINFMDIEKAVLEEKVDAGILIHESILDFNENLIVEKEIWDIWKELTKKNLPLPLGGMALKRSIPLLKAIKCEKMLSKAIEIANKHKKILSKMLTERKLVRVEGEKLSKYLNMYANKESIYMNEKQIEALNELFKIGYEYGFYKSKIFAEDYFIPQEYEKIRFS